MESQFPQITAIYINYVSTCYNKLNAHVFINMFTKNVAAVFINI